MYIYDKKDGYRQLNVRQLGSLRPWDRFPVIQAVKSKFAILAHFGLPWVRPWDYRGKCHREFNACQTPRSMYPSIFNHFWDIAIYRWRGTGFWQFSNERFYHILLSHWDNRGKCHRLEREFNACKTPRCIYASIFNRFWDIATYWSKIATFLYPASV